eukprot:m.114953 g.114953  ORF g.114953 m.114953 type:complete len:1114 (+) comp16042_c0_seq1:4134-7475(+)
MGLSSSCYKKVDDDHRAPATEPWRTVPTPATQPRNTSSTLTSSQPPSPYHQLTQHSTEEHTLYPVAPCTACTTCMTERGVVPPKTFRFSDSYELLGKEFLRDSQLDFDKVEKAASAVCRLETTQRVQVGTAVLLRSTAGINYVISNRHVSDNVHVLGLDRKKRAWANFSPNPGNGSSSCRYELQLKYTGTHFGGENTNLDIAVFVILGPENTEDAEQPTAAALELPDDFSVKGSPCLVIGYPGEAVDDDDRCGVLRLSSGIIQQVNERKTIMEHNAITSFGSSGSPLLNAEAQVIGLHFASASKDLSAKGAVYLSVVKDVVLQQQEDVRPAALADDGMLNFLQLPTSIDWTPHQPSSQLLVAGDQVVRFHPQREAVVNATLALLADEKRARLSTRLLHGPGGIGKTRTALEIVKRAKDSGWTCAWLANRLPADAVQQWKIWLEKRPASSKVLLVVDYAETRQERLLQLLEAALQVIDERAKDASSMRVHVMCLAREGSWWDRLNDSLECSILMKDWLSGTGNWGHAPLPPWASDDRSSAFQDALEDFAKMHKIYPPVSRPKLDLSHTMYERPLFIHLAALAALAGETEHNTKEALVQSQLKREFTHWKRWFGTEEPLPSEDWDDVLAWLSLVNGATLDALRKAVTAMGIAIPRFAEVMDGFYPGESKGLVAPLQPDLLGEALIQQQLGKERGRRIVSLALGESKGVVNSLAVLSRMECTHTPDFRSLAVNAPQWQHTAVKGLAEAWPVHGQVLLDVGRSLGRRTVSWLMASWCFLTPAEQESAAVGLLFRNESTSIAELLVDIARAQLRTANTANAKEDAAAAAHRNLAEFLNVLDAVFRSEALASANEAVSICHKLVMKQPALYLSELARSLNVFATILSSDASSHGIALLYAKEAVTISRMLTAEQRAAHLPELAISLNKTLSILADEGDATRQKEGLVIAHETLAAYRMILGDEQSPPHLSGYGDALNNMARLLSRQGDARSRDEALDSAREAVRIYHNLAAEQPAVYPPKYAMSLTMLSNCLSQRGDAASRFDALARARESVNIFERLATEHPDAYLRFLAASLKTLANRLSEQGDESSRTEALTRTQKADEIYLMLAAKEHARPTNRL